MARYSATLNRYVEGETVTPVASAARTTSSDSGWLASDAFNALELFLDVTAASGTTPTLNVIVETRTSAGTARTVGAAFTQATAVSSERKSFVGLGDEYRVRWTIAGTTPSFTFSVTGYSK